LYPFFWEWVEVQKFFIWEFRSLLSRTCFSIWALGISQYEKGRYSFQKFKPIFFLKWVQFVLILRKNVQKRAQMYSILVQIFWEICTKSEYFALNVRIFVHAEFLSTKILNLSANYLNNSLCVLNGLRNVFYHSNAI